MQACEEYARELTRGLALPEADKERIRREVLQHLEDEAARLVAGGASREQAEAGAIASFGREEVMAKLVGGALEARQNRFMLRRIAAVAALSTVLGAAWYWGHALMFSIFRDSLRTPDTLHSLSHVSLAVGVVYMLILSLVIGRLARLPLRYALLSGAAILVAGRITNWTTEIVQGVWLWVGLPDLLAWLPLGSGTQTGVIVWVSFCRPVMIVALSAALRPDRRTFTLAGITFSLALLNVAGFVASHLLIYAHATGVYQVVKTLADGLYWMNVAVLIWLLARALSLRFGRVTRPEASEPLPA